MSTEENLSLIRRRFDEHPIVGGDDDALEEIYSPDVLLHGAGESFRGVEGVRRAAEITRAAFSDIEFTVDSMEADGDRVVTHISGRSKHTGEFQGVPPSGEWVTVHGIVASTVRDGKIVEEWRSVTWSSGS